LDVSGRDDIAVPWNRGWRKRDPINTIVLGGMAALVNAIRSRTFDGGSGSENRVISDSLVKGSWLKSDLLPQPRTFVIRKSLEETFPDPIQYTLLAFYSPDGGDGMLFPVARDRVVTIDEACGIQSQV